MILPSFDKILKKGLLNYGSSLSFIHEKILINKIFSSIFLVCSLKPSGHLLIASFSKSNCIILEKVYFLGEKSL